MKRDLAEMDLAFDAPRYWSNGRFTIVTTTAGHYRGGGRLPMSLTLMFRAGDDRAYAGYDLTWSDVEELHKMLSHELKNRRRLVGKFGRAQRRGTPRPPLERHAADEEQLLALGADKPAGS